MKTTERQSATVRNINRALESQNPIRVKHNLGNSILIDSAKPMGFGSKAVMVRFHQGNGWTLIDPVTWSIV